MEHTELSDEQRASIARGWRRSGLTQAAYAKGHSVTDRTLRAWIARWAPISAGRTEVVREVCELAILRLQSLVADLEPDSGVAAEGLTGTRPQAPEASSTSSAPKRGGFTWTDPT